MQTQLRRHYDQIVQLAGIAMLMSRAAVCATVLTWAPGSGGAANDSAAPSRSSATPDRVVHPTRGDGDRGTQPTCAGLGAVVSATQLESMAASAGGIGCGVRGNLAGGRPASRQSEAQTAPAILLAWHMQVRGLSQ